MKYTKGEWYIEEYPEHFDIRSLDYGFDADVAHVFKRKGCEANAHLIAAAPDMYEALKYAFSILTGGRQVGLSDWGIKMQKALAKAEGRDV